MVQLLAQPFLLRLIHNAHRALESRVNRAMVREAKRCGVVVDLPEIVALDENSVTPRRYARLLRRVVHIGAKVVFVGWHERDASFRIEAERGASDHLQIELVIRVQRLKIAHFDETTDFVIAQSDPIVEITKPDHRVVIFD